MMYGSYGIFYSWFLMTGTKPYSNVKFRSFSFFFFFFVVKNVTVKVSSRIKKFIDFKKMEYISFRKMLKSLKSQFGGLKIVDRTMLFECFDIKSIDSDSIFFVSLSQSLYNLKFMGLG